MAGQADLTRATTFNEHQIVLKKLMLTKRINNLFIKQTHKAQNVSIYKYCKNDQLLSNTW